VVASRDALAFGDDTTIPANFGGVTIVFSISGIGCSSGGSCGGIAAIATLGTFTGNTKYIASGDGANGGNTGVSSRSSNTGVVVIGGRQWWWDALVAVMDTDGGGGILMHW
jgi:hypothetical protein